MRAAFWASWLHQQYKTDFMAAEMGLQKSGPAGKDTWNIYLGSDSQSLWWAAMSLLGI